MAPCAHLADHTRPLAQLSARHGAFLVTGNHEYYSGADKWIAEFRRLGLTVLMNQHVVLDHDGARAVVAGVTDYSAGSFDPAHKSDPAAALRGAPADASVRLLLAHQPRSAPAAAEGGLHVAVVRAYARRTVLAVEFFRAAAAAVRCRTRQAQRACGSTRAAAPAIGDRRSGSARLRRSRDCVSWRPDGKTREERVSTRLAPDGLGRTTDVRRGTTRTRVPRLGKRVARQASEVLEACRTSADRQAGTRRTTEARSYRSADARDTGKLRQIRLRRLLLRWLALSLR